LQIPATVRPRLRLGTHQPAGDDAHERPDSQRRHPAEAPMGTCV